MSEHFDPSEQETKELLPTNDTPESAYIGDTNADPECGGSFYQSEHCNA